MPHQHHWHLLGAATRPALASDEQWLDVVERAVARDLEECVDIRGDTLQVRDPHGRRTLPYLVVGSAGVLVAVARLAEHRPTPAWLSTIRMLARACASEIVVQPGLMLGRAGLLLALAHPRDLVDLPPRVITRHIDVLDLHAVRATGAGSPSRAASSCGCRRAPETSTPALGIGQMRRGNQLGLVLDLQELDGIDTTEPAEVVRSSASAIDCNTESALSGSGCTGDTGGDGAEPSLGDEGLGPPGPAPRHCRESARRCPSSALSCS